LRSEYSVNGRIAPVLTLLAGQLLFSRAAVGALQATYIAKTNDRASHLYEPFTLIIPICSTVGGMSEDEQGRSGVQLFLFCLAAVIFSAVLFISFQLTASP
jgi:hypothetical protein